jgi:hypothetical protein
MEKSPPSAVHSPPQILSEHFVMVKGEGTFDQQVKFPAHHIMTSPPPLAGFST